MKLIEQGEYGDPFFLKLSLTTNVCFMIFLIMDINEFENIILQINTNSDVKLK